MMSSTERALNVNEQISRIAGQLGRSIKKALVSLWTQLCQFADAVSGGVRSPGGQPARKKAVRRAGQAAPAPQQDTGSIAQILDQRRKKKRYRPIRRLTRQRVYRLQGYTTVSKINARRKSEKRQRILRQLLLILVIILVIILLFNLYNPIRDLTEWYRIIGIRDLGDLAGSDPLTPAPTATPAASGSIIGNLSKITLGMLR